MTKQFFPNDFCKKRVQSYPIQDDSRHLAAASSAIVALTREHYPINSTKIAQSASLSVAAAVWSSIAARNCSAAEIRPLFSEIEVTPLPRSLLQKAAEFAKQASRSAPIWVAYEVGEIYSSLLPKTDRKSGGIHFTPPKIAEEIVRQATKQKPEISSARILEPSAGGGVLLSAILERLLGTGIENGKDLLVNLPSRVVAIERDPFAAWLAQIAVDLTLLRTAVIHGLELPRIVRVADTLQQTFENDFDVVLMNPPYRRTSLNSEQRIKFGRSLYGHANAYSLFLDQALRATKLDGVIAALTPTSYLSSQYFKNLRGTLRSEATLEELGIFDSRSRVFAGIQQELAISTFRKSVSGGPSTVARLSLHPPTPVKAELLGRFSLPQELSAPWIIPKSRDQVPMVWNALQAKSRLSEWGYTIRTGAVVWNRFKPQISHTQQPGGVPLIWSACIRPGEGFSWPPEARKDKAWIHMKADQERFLQKNPCVLLQRTTSREQFRRLNATPLPTSMIDEFGAVAIENHVQILEPVSERAPVSLKTLAAFLNSNVADALFRCVSGSVSVSAFELNALPLPAPDKLCHLDALVARPASAEEIDHEIQRLYRAANETPQ